MRSDKHLSGFDFRKAMPTWCYFTSHVLFTFRTSHAQNTAVPPKTWHWAERTCLRTGPALSGLTLSRLFQMILRVFIVEALSVRKGFLSPTQQALRCKAPCRGLKIIRAGCGFMGPFGVRAETNRMRACRYAPMSNIMYRRII